MRVDTPLLASQSPRSGTSATPAPAPVYEEITFLEHYDVRLQAPDVEKRLRERYNSYPRVTFAIGACMLMIGFQWMVQQLIEEQAYEKEHKNRTEIPKNATETSGSEPEYNPKCYVNTKCSYEEDSTESPTYGHNPSHVLSNAVYIAVGLVTGMYVCYRRMKIWSKDHKTKAGDNGTTGDCKHGLYTARCNGMYANASMALMVEGCLSGLYHICPTKWNNQFDYIGITMVCMSLFLMLWSKRHPLIISVGSWAVFFGFVSIVCGLSALNAKQQHPRLKVVVWGLYIIFYFLFMPRLFVMLHYGLPFVTPDKTEFKLILNDKSASWNAIVDIPRHTKVFFSLMWSVGIVWFAYCIYEEMMLTAAVMKYSCLFLASYMLFYIVMESWEYNARQPKDEEDPPKSKEMQNMTQEPGKPAAGGDEKDRAGAKGDDCSGDKKDECPICSRALTIAIAVGTMVIAAIGAYFFCNDVYKTTVTIEESEREYNKKCYVAGLDNHDLWHLCSGIALGGVIVVSTRLEDLSKGVPHKDLLVF